MNSRTTGPGSASLEELQTYWRMPSVRATRELAKQLRVRRVIITGRCCVVCGSSSSISIPDHQLKIPLISIPLNGGGRDIGCGSDKTASD
jgi:hypothetical protein